MAFDYSSVKNKKRKNEKSNGFDYSSVVGRTERTDEEKREYVKQRNAVSSPSVDELRAAQYAKYQEDERNRLKTYNIKEARDKKYSLEQQLKSIGGTTSQIVSSSIASRGKTAYDADRNAEIKKLKDEISRLNNDIENAKAIQDEEYYNGFIDRISASKDFEQLSQIGRAKYQQKVDSEPKSVIETLFPNSKKVKEYSDWIKDRDIGSKVSKANWEEYTEEEKNLYGYILEKYPDKADDFLLRTNERIEREKRENLERKAIKMGEDNSVVSAVGALGANILSPVDYLSGLQQMGYTKHLYGEASMIEPGINMTRFASSLNEGVTNAIEDSTDFEIGGVNAASFLYGTGMSVANSALLVSTMGPAAAGVMSLQAASSTTMDALDRGLTDAQAVELGAAAGIAEYLGEKMSIEHFFKFKDIRTARQAVKHAAAQAGIEASEEAMTTVINTIADFIISGDKSEYATNVAFYLSEGKTQKEAEGLALADAISGLIQDTIGGAISGFAFGSAGVAINSFSRNQERKAEAKKTVKDFGEDKQPIIDYAMKAEEGSEVRKAAEDIKARMEKGETVSDKEFADILIKADDSFAAAEIKKQIAYEAKTNNETYSDEELGQMSTSVLKTMRGDLISESENARIEKSKAARNVYARNTGREYTYGEAVKKAEMEQLNKNEHRRKMEELVSEQSDAFKKTLNATYESYKESGAQNLLDEEKFADHFSTFYDFGKAGIESVDEIFEAHPAMAENPVLKNALEQAYVLGRGEAIAANKANIENKQSEIDAKLQAAKGENRTSVGKVRLATETELKNPKIAAVGGKVVTKGKNLSRQHRAMLQFVREFAKLSGINMVLFEGGKSWGWYDSKNNEIFLNIEEGMSLKTLSHELTHFIQQHSPKHYEEFKQFLLDYYKENGKYQQLLEQAHSKQEDLSAEELEDEIIANACQMFISDTEAMQKLIDTQSKGLIETITRWFRDMCDYLRQAFEGVKASHAAAQALEEDIEMLEKARDKWYELLNESITVNKQIGTNAKNQARNYDESKQQFEYKESEKVAKLREDYLSKFSERQQVQTKLRELNKSEEYLNLLDNMVALGGTDESIEAVNKWQKDSGYEELFNREKVLEQAVKEANEKYEKEKLKEEKAYEKSQMEAKGLSENDYHRNLAVKEFGYTPYFYDAGYILPNGKMLNFSGEKGRHYGSRGQDHRAIGTIFIDDISGSEAMVKFMHEGNIRIMAESPAVDFASNQVPTSEQYATIKKFIRQYAKEEYFSVDFTDERGYTIDSYEYEDNISAERIVNDIKYYFENGKTRKQSDVSRFHFEMKDSEGNELSSEQAEFFKNSKVRDENGNLLVLYHGGYYDTVFTGRGEGFTYNRNAIYMSEREDIASAFSYGSRNTKGNVYKLYANIKNPFVIDAEGRSYVDIPIPDDAPESLKDKFWYDNTADLDNLPVWAEQEGYDGIIVYNVREGVGGGPATEVIAFRSNQVKFVDNKAPTKDPDIRFELKDDIDNLVLANYNSIRLPAEEYARLSHAVGTYQAQTRGFTTQILDNKKGYPAYKYLVYVRNDGRLVVLFKSRMKAGNGGKKQYVRKKGNIDSTINRYRHLAGYNNNSGGRIGRGSVGRNDRISDSETRIRDRSNERGSYKSVAYLSEEEWQNFLDDWLDRSDFQFELKDEDENRLEILENQEERLVNDLKTLEKYYGDAIRQVYEQDIKPNEGISKRAEELNRKAARRFMNEVGAMFHVPKDTREEYLLPIINEIIDKGPAISDSEGLIDRLYQTAYEHTEDYIVDTDPEGNYKNLRDYIRKTSIFVNAGTKADVGDYNNFRKRNMGSLRLTNDQTALGLDDFYEEVSNLAPEIFTGTTDGAEQLYELSSFMKDRGRTESIGGFMPQAEYTAWADETLEPELNKLFDSTIGSFLSESTRKEKERQRAAKVDRAMENVTGAVKNYEAVQDYARAEGVLAGQIEQGKKDAAEMRRMQESFERKAKNYEDMIEAKRAKIKEIRQRRDEILAERAEAYRKYKEQRSESIKGGALRKRIERNAKTLGDWLLKNSDKEHIPEALKATVGEFLTSIDFTSKRALGGGEETQKDMKFGVRLNNLANVLKRQQDYMNGANEGKDNPIDAYLDLPEGFAEEISKLAETVLNASENRGFTVNEMNSEQLAQLDKMLRVLKTSIGKMNKLLANAHFASVTEAAKSSMRELAEYKNHKLHGKNIEQANAMLEWGMFTPVYAFGRYGKAGASIFEGIQKGWNDFAFAIKKILNFTKATYTDKEVSEWGKEVHTVTLASGKEIKITTAQLMSFYCLLKREQARGHIFGGGVRIADIAEGKEKIQQTDNFLISEEDVQTLYDELTPRQIDVANKLQKFMTEQGSEWGNTVSMERFGYRAFTEDNYFPIETDDNNRIAIDPEAKANDMFRLLNMSATKGLVKGANNALVVSDIFDVFSNHMSDMAKYGTLALPILDTMKWYNYKVKYDQGNGQFTTETVQKSVERVYGSVGKSYFTNFMKDLNGVREGGRGTNFLNKLTSNYKVAAVGFNLRTAVLQPTSIIRAINVIEPKYLVETMHPLRNAKEAEKYSGIALWKSLGFYNTDIARGIREQIKGGEPIDKIRDKSMWFAEQADRATWGVLWNAAKLKAKDQGFKGEELNRKAAEIFDEIIYKTQVVDSTLTRSELMRNKNINSFTAFMAEPTISYNMVADSVFNIRREKDFSTGFKKYGNTFARSASVYMLSTFITSAVQSIADAMRDDDDDETAIEKFWQAFYGEKFFDGNFVAEFNPLEKLPFIRDAFSILRGYSNERMETSAISSLVKACGIIWETYRVEVRGEKPTATTYYGKMTGYGKVYATAKAISQLSGLPFSNAMREGVTIWNLVIGNMAPSLKLKTYDDSKKK